MRIVHRVLGKDRRERSWRDRPRLRVKGGVKLGRGTYFLNPKLAPTLRQYRHILFLPFQKDLMQIHFWREDNPAEVDLWDGASDPAHTATEISEYAQAKKISAILQPGETNWLAIALVVAIGVMGILGLVIWSMR